MLFPVPMEAVTCTGLKLEAYTTQLEKLPRKPTKNGPGRPPGRLLSLLPGRTERYSKLRSRGRPGRSFMYQVARRRHGQLLHPILNRNRIREESPRVGRGRARYGKARQGAVRQGLARWGREWRGMVGQGTVGSGVVRQGEAGKGLVWLCEVRRG